jgi:hypothetical protein|tara:strand:+ start:376 stop:642 length:267 start_codon:yes stop_codon:yes gene_type:complete
MGWAAPERVGEGELTALKPGTGNAVIQHSTGWPHEGPTGLRFFSTEGLADEEDTSGALPIERHKPLACVIEGTPSTGIRFGVHYGRTK